MVGSDGFAKGMDAGQAPGEAAQALTAILQTHYLRYLIIVSWALGLIATIGLTQGLVWFVAGGGMAMVGADGLAKGMDAGQAPGEAAQALTAILQTHYLRYLVIVSWALGLIATTGLTQGLVWFVATLGADWGMIFPAVAT